MQRRSALKRMRTALFCAALSMAAATGIGASGAADVRAAVVGLSALGTGNFSTAYSVNGDGTVVSGHVDNQAFRWTAAGVQRLGYLPGGTANSNGYGMTADGGVIVGNSASTASGLNGSEAMRWTAATGMQPLGDLPGGNFFSFARNVSDDGNVVVGRGQSAGGDEAFRWTAAGGIVGLGDISGGPFYSEAEAASHDGSIVVGRSYDAANPIAFRWTAQTGMTPIPSRPDLRPTHAYAITPDGEIIVGQAIGPGTSAFRWSARDGIQRLGSGSAIALGVSDDGNVIVGQMYPANEAGVWDSAHGWRSLSSILAAHNVNLTGWTLGSASDVSGDGSTVVGQGTLNGRVVAYRAVIPEPASLGWIALAALALRRRPRQANARHGRAAHPPRTADRARDRGRAARRI